MDDARPSGSATGYDQPTTAGDYTVLFIAAINGTFAGTFELYGSPGVTVLRSREWQDTFGLNPNDFVGDDHTKFVDGSGSTVVHDATASLPAIAGADVLLP